MITQTNTNTSNHHNWNKTHISESIFKYMEERSSLEKKTDSLFDVDMMQSTSLQMADIVMGFKSLINDETDFNDVMERVSDLAYRMLEGFESQRYEEHSKRLGKVPNEILTILSPYAKLPEKFEKKILDERTRKIHMQTKNDLNELIALRDQEIEKIQKRLIISERKGCSITDVTVKDIRAYDLEEQKNKSQQLQNDTLEADKNLAAFLSDLDKETKSKQKSQKTQKKTKQAHAAQSKGKKEDVGPNKKEATAAKPIKSKKKQGTTEKISGQKLRHEFVSTLYKIGTKEDYRVTQRWITQDPEIIRQFWDRNKDGALVQRYIGMSDEQIATQRAFHYLPGIEKILVNTDHRRIYTFPSDKGYGVYAELIMNKKNYNGTIYFGIGVDDKVIFHKYFEERKPSDANINAIFLDKEAAPRNNNEDKNWECTTNQSFEMDEKGVLTIKFDGEDHYIRLFPVRKDLIKAELLTN